MQRRFNRLGSLAPLTAMMTAAVSASGCIYETHHDPYGTIAFDWMFDGISTCSEAGVDEVDLVVLQGNEVVLALEREPCVGGGLELSDILEGNYEVVIDAFDRESVLLYTGGFTVNVVGSRRNFAGVINLRPVGEPPPPPPPDDGDIELFWGFVYPNDDSEAFDCDFAGVEEVDVIVTPYGDRDPVYVETFDCHDEGVSVGGLLPGDYDVEVLGYGSYHDESILLYDSGVVPAMVHADSITELGDVLLDRVDENFSDFDVAWSFMDETCASAGVVDITVTISRLGAAEPDDVVVTDCTMSNLVRRTFVPGSYSVGVGGVGDDADWIGAVTVDLRPGSEAQVDLVLAPQ
jgi:hypothetical protein